MRLFNRTVIALRRLAMAAEHRELVPHHFGVAADVAGVGQAGDRTQCELLAAAGDHHRRAGLLHGFWLEDRVLDVEIPAMKRRSLLRPHCEDKPNGFFHLPDAHRRPGRKLPAILAVFGFEGSASTVAWSGFRGEYSIAFDTTA